MQLKQGKTTDEAKRCCKRKHVLGITHLSQLNAQTQLSLVAYATIKLKLFQHAFIQSNFILFSKTLFKADCRKDRLKSKMQTEHTMQTMAVPLI